MKAGLWLATALSLSAGVVFAQDLVGQVFDDPGGGTVEVLSVQPLAARFDEPGWVAFEILMSAGFNGRDAPRFGASAVNCDTGAFEFILNVETRAELEARLAKRLEYDTDANVTDLNGMPPASAIAAVARSYCAGA